MKLRLALIFFSFALFACSVATEDVILPTSPPEKTSFISTSPPPTRSLPSITPSPFPLPTRSSTPSFTATLQPSATRTPTPDISFYDTAACLPRNTSVLQGTVTQVIDGDTIVISTNDGITHTVRYIGIDAPESGMPFGTAATDGNTQLVLGQPVMLIQDVSETDQYGRLLRYVVVGSTLVNLELVRLGFASAQTWPPDTACADAFQAAEEEARLAQVGMWSPTPSPEPSAPRVVIVAVNERDEYVDIQNQGDADVDLAGWNLVSERGHQGCPLSGVLAAGNTLRVWAMSAQGPGFSCGYTSPIWNNSEPDPAVLYDPQGVEVSRK